MASAALAVVEAVDEGEGAQEEVKVVAVGGEEEGGEAGAEEGELLVEAVELGGLLDKELVAGGEEAGVEAVLAGVLVAEGGARPAWG
ncbi:MAG: hypothetical protein HY330_03600 [Chloroflexi bacterium]|nr:hypothetical protein [Chloroflexota bacterium]